MRTGLAAAAATIATVIITSQLGQQEPDVVYQTEVIERTVVLMSEDLDKQLEDECVAIIVRLTGDPEQGIRNLIERHYQGDACEAAYEALRGDW
jgi:hypothetical protein